METRRLEITLNRNRMTIAISLTLCGIKAIFRIGCILLVRFHRLMRAILLKSFSLQKGHNKDNIFHPPNISWLKHSRHGIDCTLFRFRIFFFNLYHYRESLLSFSAAFVNLHNLPVHHDQLVPVQ